jgi:hypothetical protein
MIYEVTNQQLTDLETRWRTSRPHLVILGAGASVAAFPTGDARGRRLPLMNNFVDVLGLRSIVKDGGNDANQGFESLYSSLFAADPDSPRLKEIEASVAEYFGALELPPHPTLYDFLLLSLREKDAILTFNWDPFLADACVRNAGEAPLPHIFHLHGNVHVSFCTQCQMSMPNADVCPTCERDLKPTPLLYPIEKKNYASDPFISLQWQAARKYIRRAAIITIFGYSAPTTDQEAMAIFTDAWKADDPDKPVERVEIIDIRDREELSRQWSSFAFFDHYDIHRNFFDSILARYPRRSCEALGHMGFDGQFVESIPWAGNLEGVRKSIEQLIAAED